jgi:hypothetical protein
MLLNTNFLILKCLDVITGRLSKNVVMTGNVLLNGKKKNPGYGFVVSIQ